MSANEITSSRLPSILPVKNFRKRARLNFLTNVARDLVINQLNKLEHGLLVLIDGNQELCFGEKSSDFPVEARITVNNPQFFCDLAFGGSIGAGEAYMLGHWHADSLTNVIRVMTKNMSVLDEMEGGTASLAVPLRKMLHWFNRNTKQGSRKNIAAHYDLGNELFKIFLDPTMMYSSGIFERLDDSMEQASIAKLKRICDKLDLNENDHVVEIGTGWGGFAIYAALNYGCRVTTTTISKKQYELAQQRVHNTGLQDKVTVLLKDYRELEGKYDKLVSIEMIEAVGHKFYDTFFKQCTSLLKSDGIMLLQAITIADQRYEQAKKAVDFIQRYIFPGGCLPSVTTIQNSLTASTDLRLFHHEDIGPHYATTLQKWRDEFFENIEDVKKLGYSKEFIRMWDFYLSYCEGGFQERAISAVHMVFTKPDNRQANILASI